MREEERKGGRERGREGRTEADREGRKEGRRGKEDAPLRVPKDTLRAEYWSCARRNLSAVLHSHKSVYSVCDKRTHSIVIEHIL